MDEKTLQKLQELFVSYTKKLPYKLHLLQTAWINLQANFDPKKLQDFHREAHSLTGSAGTYGYTELSKAARQLEIFLKSLLESNEITKDAKITITNLLNKIESTLLIADEDAFYPLRNQSQPSKLIYVLDQDTEFVSELIEEFSSTGYHFEQMHTFDELYEAIKKTLPLTMLIDVKFLGVHESQKLLELKKNDFVVPLFCTSVSGDIVERLKAVRAGSNGFIRKPVDVFYLIKMLEQIIGLTTNDIFRILIVDDSPALAEYYSYILKEAGMEVHFISNALQTLDVIAEFQPHLLLLDIYMPDCTGVELAAILRQEPRYMHIPIIFLSSEEDKVKQLAALNIGGDDFLTKPILPQHLIAAVKSRAKRGGVLSSYMMSDSLTGLLNHSTILHQLEVELGRVHRHEHPVVFAMIDIDNFKLVNDRYGHLIGDRVLKKLSELLVMRLRKSDYVGRYGGEEFAIILPNTKLLAAKKIIDELRQKFSQIHFVGENYDFTVSFSGGMTSLEKTDNVQQIVAAADAALYKAKQAGKNQIILS